MRRHSVSHLAMFSASIPSSSPSTWAATAEGASPITDPGPCLFPHGSQPGHGGRLPGTGRADQHVEHPSRSGDLLDGECLVHAQSVVPAGQVRLGELGPRGDAHAGSTGFLAASSSRASAPSSASLV